MHCGSATCPSEDGYSVNATTAVVWVKKEVCFTLVMPISPIPILSYPVPNHGIALLHSYGWEAVVQLVPLVALPHVREVVSGEVGACVYDDPV